jgi:sugar diacid utilization regulator
MQVFSLEQIKEHADGQGPSDFGLHSHLSSSEPVLPPPIVAKPTVYDVFRLMTTLTQAPSLQAMLHESTQMITRVIEQVLCLILLPRPLHSSQLQLAACVPALLGEGVEMQAVTIPADLMERLQGAVVHGRVLQLSTQEQDALNPFKDLEYADLCAIPLIRGDTYLGMILCYSSIPFHLPDEEQLILCMLASQMALAVGHYQRVEREEREQQQRQVHAFMSDLLHADAIYTGAVLQKRACLLGCNLAAPHLVVSLQLLPLLGNSSVTEEERFARIRAASTRTRRYIHEQYPGSLTDGESEQILCLLHLETGRTVDAVNQEFDKLAALLRDGQHMSLFAGISTPCHALNEYRRGYAQAQEALQVTQWLRQQGGSASFDTLGVYRYLYRFARENVLSDAYQAQIATLAAYDQCRHTNLLETLETYLECGMNIAEASHLLHVHRNTIQQRLERIQSLCALDLGQRTNWLPFLVALKVHRLTSPGE